jgi:DEAD/DEAH box helicase domain-containing protein
MSKSTSGWKSLGKSRRPKSAGRQYVEKNGYGQNWPKQRKAALERDQYTCQKCGFKGTYVKKRGWTVHVHHKTKIALFYNMDTRVIDYEGANDLGNLITLCPTCHKVADGHAKMKGFKYLK